MDCMINVKAHTGVGVVPFPDCCWWCKETETRLQDSSLSNSILIGELDVLQNKNNYQPVTTFSQRMEGNLQKLRAGIGGQIQLSITCFCTATECPQISEDHLYFQNWTSKANLKNFPVIACYGEYFRIKSLAYFQRSLYQNYFCSYFVCLSKMWQNSLFLD